LRSVPPLAGMVMGTLSACKTLETGKAPGQHNKAWCLGAVPKKPITAAYGLTHTTSRQRQMLKSGVSVEKVPQLMLVAVQGSGYKQARVLNAAVHHYIWRPAAHDGAPIPLRSVVLLLPPGRSSS